MLYKRNAQLQIRGFSRDKTLRQSSDGTENDTSKNVVV